jgi:steroid delta-isomerase-like uncharacterized protein
VLPGRRWKEKIMLKQDLERIDDRGMAAWDDHDPDAFADLFADDFVMRDSLSPQPLTTRADVITYLKSWFTAFPDMHSYTTNRIVSDDAIAAEIEFDATNSGPLVIGGIEIPATGKSVHGTGTYFAKVRDGKVVQFNAHPDAAGMMAQLGLMPNGGSA